MFRLAADARLIQHLILLLHLYPQPSCFPKRKSVLGGLLLGPEVYLPPRRRSICLSFNQINKTTSQHYNYSTFLVYPLQFYLVDTSPPCVGPVQPWTFPFPSPIPQPPTASARQRRGSVYTLASILAVKRCLPEPSTEGMRYAQCNCLVAY